VSNKVFNRYIYWKRGVLILTFRYVSLESAIIIKTRNSVRI